MKVTVAALLACAASFVACPAQAGSNIIASLVTAQSACLPNAFGRLTLSETGGVQHMHIEVFNFPPIPDSTSLSFKCRRRRSAWAGIRATSRRTRMGSASWISSACSAKRRSFSRPGVAPAPAVFPVDATSNSCDAADPDLSCRHLVRLADGGRERRLREHGDEVQRRTQRGRAGD